jgi:hypothetical protein
LWILLYVEDDAAFTLLIFKLEIYTRIARSIFRLVVRKCPLKTVVLVGDNISKIRFAMHVVCL